MGSLGGLVSLCYLKYPQSGKRDLQSFFGSHKIFDLTENTKKCKIYFLCGDNESEDMVTDLNKMEYPIKHKAMLLFEFK
jgi:hypothetical protein